RIDRSLATSAPEEARDTKSGGGRDTVGGAGGFGGCVGEENCLWIEDGGQFAVRPQRIDFGEIDQIERALLQARKVEQYFEPVEDGVGIPVHMVEAVACLAVVTHLGAAR